MPWVKPEDRPALLDWMKDTGREIPADPSYIHESTWAEHLRHRIGKANAEETKS